MVALIVIVTIIVFVIVDFALRQIMQKMQATKVSKARAEALDIGLKLDFAQEAKSLKRVEVDNPRARILAVDDEEVVLDSFRKILVLAGYSIDTVLTGQEALGLVQKAPYDFVFTDLKMPEMDGIDVTKAVKHLRPDIDVIMITGYATVESAVETMKYGAMDYVQKPFTEEELVGFVDKSLIRRQDRIAREVTPKVHLVTPSSGESSANREFNVPSGIFVSPQHTWANIELNGLIRVGIDDFARKIIGKIDRVELPKIGVKIRKGAPLFSIEQGSRRVTIPSPVSGIIAHTNDELLEHAELVTLKPYELGWICSIEPTNLAEELQSLKIGVEAVSWYRKEVDRFCDLEKQTLQQTETAGTPEPLAENVGEGQVSGKLLDAFSKSFLQARVN